jgi:hypothetical protein
MSGASFRFKDGKLLIFDEETVCVIESWPSLKAVRKKTGGRWEVYEPIFQLVFDAEADSLFGEAHQVLETFHLTYQRRASFRAFRYSLPAGVAAACAGIPARQWMMLRLMQSSEAAAELASSNRALAFALSHSWFFRERYSTHEGAAIVAKRRRKEIADWLGFPPTDAAANMLSKLASGSITIQTLKKIRALFVSPLDSKMLFHLRRINAGVVAIMSDPALGSALSMNLLGEVSESSSEDSEPQAAALLSQILTMSATLDRGLPRPSSLEKLEALHFEISTAYLKKYPPGDGPLPKPPLEDSQTIKAIRSIGELIAEGREQNHCAATYVQSIRSGRLFIYKLLQPERATLSIIRGPSGEWGLQQIRAHSNALVKKSTLSHVKKWLENRPIKIRS